MTAYLAGVQERLRRAELDRVEERARRRLTTVAAAAVILLGLAGGGGYVWNQQQKAERVAKTARAVDEALADAARLLGEAQAAPPGDAGRWSEAVAAAKRAEGLLAQGEADAPLAGPGDALLAGARARAGRRRGEGPAIEVDRVLLADLEVGPRQPGRARRPEADRRRLRRAFRKAGLDLDATEPAEAGQWLAARTDPVEMAGYLDDWAFVRRGRAGPRPTGGGWWPRRGRPTPTRGATPCGRSSGATTPRRSPSSAGWPTTPRPGGPARARPVVAGPSAQVRLRRRRAGRAGPAEGRAATRATSGSISSWPAPR